MKKTSITSEDLSKMAKDAADRDLEISASRPKRPYVAPRLVTLGTVRELTHKAGSVHDDNVVSGRTRQGR